MPKTSVPPRLGGSAAPAAPGMQASTLAIANARARAAPAPRQFSFNIPRSFRGYPEISSCAQARDCRLIHIDAKAGTRRQCDETVAERQRLPHDVLGQIEMREANTPVRRRQGAGQVHGRGRPNARLGDLGGDIDLEAEALAQGGSFQCSSEAAELDQ